ncbi:MAG: hypothetical protein JNK34_10260 [Tabrizicola sp.]|nr:hypothetical protein [Tabrizicola sp.]
MPEAKENEDPYFERSSARLTWLLEGQTVEWVRQDSDRNLTVKFVKGPVLYVDISDATSPELDLSVVSSKDTALPWEAHAERVDGPPPPGRRKR